MDAEKSSAQQPMEHRPFVSLASTVIGYFDLKARLLAVESKQASNHFVGAFNFGWGAARSCRIERPHVRRVSAVFGITSSPFSLGLECIDLRSDPYPGWRLCFSSSKSAARQAGISDDVKRSWKGQRMAEPVEDIGLLSQKLEEDRQKMAVQAGELKGI